MRLVDANTPVQGFADHLVSEAIYLADPEGNGIEIYRDRPKAEWPYEGEQLKMGTEPLDVEGLLAQAKGNRDNLASGTQVGHIHLHVSDIAQAESFYTGVLGFDLVLRYGPSAAFFSVDGYHHHIGVNTWAGEGAPSPPAGSQGLRHFVIRVEDGVEIAQIASRAEKEGVLIAETELGLQLHDPSANAIVLTSKIV
jgi:catechol 2,3-dioxygenase